MPPGRTLFGLTEAQIAEFGMTFGIGAFIAFMLFIIWDLAQQSKAGQLGTFILFFVLAFGMIGFVAKSIIAKLLGSEPPVAGGRGRPLQGEAPPVRAMTTGVDSEAIAVESTIEDATGPPSVPNAFDIR